jgi:hypothetical protein
MACLVALPMIGFSQVAISADYGFYITGDVGSTNVDESSLDDNDISFHPSVGYDFNENWAVQVGYDSLGEPSDSCGTGCTIALDDFWGANVKLVGTLPLNDKWGLFASVGWQHWETDISVDDTTFGLTVDDDDGDEVVGGVGAEWKVGKTFYLKTGFDYFQADDLDVTTFYIGGAKRFH